MKRRIWSWMLVLALFFGSLPAIHAEEADVPKVPTEEIERVTEWTGEVTDAEEYPVVGETGRRDTFDYIFLESVDRFRKKFAIRYTGSDVVDLVDYLRYECYVHGGNIQYGKTYLSWMPEFVSFKHGLTSNGTLFYFDVSYRHTAEEEEELNRMVDDVLARLIDERMDEVTKVRQIDQYIVLTNCFTGEGRNSPFSLMKKESGHDVSYAMLTYKMLKRANFDVVLVRGRYIHFWVKVKVDGEWYNLSPFLNEAEIRKKNSRKYMWEASLVSDKAWNGYKQLETVDYPQATSTKYDAENDERIVEYSEMEVERILYRGAEMFWDELLAKNFTMAPATDLSEGRRNRIVITFNQELGNVDSAKIELHRMEKGVWTFAPRQVTVEGNKVILTNEDYFEPGVYYLFLSPGIESRSGKTTKKSYYRKIIVTTK